MKHTKESFTIKGNNVHGNKYDYSKVVYSNNSTHVDITCPIHGDFTQRPSDHLMGKGCTECGRLRTIDKHQLTTAEFISKAAQIHACRYDYSQTKYIKFNEKVDILCEIHGKFSQKPYQHLQGQGCQTCADSLRGAGYRNEPTILYCLYFPKYNLWKVGITAKRVGIKSRYKNDSEEYAILQEKLFTTGKEAVKEEKNILRCFHGYLYNGEPILSKGNTELLTIDPSKSLAFAPGNTKNIYDTPVWEVFG